jgi:hypothetical protein
MAHLQLRERNGRACPSGYALHTKMARRSVVQIVCRSQTVQPHPVQKCAPGKVAEPQRQQYRPSTAAGRRGKRASGSAAQAHTRATIQPIPVHPRKRLNRRIPVASRLFRPMIAGRKYNRNSNSRESTADPPESGAAATPAGLYRLVRAKGRFCSTARTPLV